MQEIPRKKCYFYLLFPSMKSTTGVFMLGMSMFFLLLSGCSTSLLGSGRQGDGDTAREFEQQIPEPLTSSVQAGGDVALGDLQAHKVGVVVQQ